MKPLKLTINAFGPFVTKQEIDFADLDGGEIFLVTGETGAGKTTIFDAICFALFGAASGDSRKPNMFKSDHAAAQEICYVELLFALHGREYFIRRTPAQRGLKRDGSTKEIAPTAELHLPNGETLTGANAVTERIEEILGLSYRQFKQTTMLAQGEFKRMIEATGREKQQIFSKIFGTSVYSDLTELLVREEAELARVTQGARDAIARCIRELGGYGYPALQQENAMFMPYERIAEAVGDGLALFEEKSALLDEDILRLESEKAKLDPEKAKSVNERLDRIDKLRAEIARLHAEEATHAERETKLKLLTAAVDLGAREDIILSAKKQSEQLETQITRLATSLEALQQKERGLAEHAACGSAEMQSLSAQLDAQKNAHERLYRAFLDGQSAILAASLQDDVPCPVCGSAHHPAPATVGEDIPTEKAVADAKNTAANLQKKLDALREAEKQAHWNAKADCEKCAAQLDAAKAHKEAIDAEFARQRAAFVETLEKSGFDGYKGYRRVLAEKDGLAALKLQVERQRERLIAAEAQLAALEDSARGAAHLARQDVDAILKRRQELDAALKAARENKSELYAALSGTKKRLAELKNLFDENAENDRRHAIARELSALARGSRTVSFERYMLAAYFDDIIKLSNIHLQRMSGSRYRLRRVEDSNCGRGDKAAGSGLDMEIVDSYTGKPRDISTLSGGESFKASLSLALGLSGVVQMYAGGVSIDTMFIDEGFGSLDEKSLDSAVETLFSLKKSGRMVGIISHVPQLRGYIPRKLAVRYTPTGSSAAWS